jgi:hypothetical protein
MIKDATLDTDALERRRYKREAIKGSAVQYKKIDFLKLFHKLSDKYFILDISQNGIQFVTREKFKKDTKLLLTITAPFIDGESINVNGYVLWSKKLTGLPGYTTGVRFTSIEPDDRARLKVLLVHEDLEKMRASGNIKLNQIIEIETMPQTKNGSGSKNQ